MVKMFQAYKRNVQTDKQAMLEAKHFNAQQTDAYDVLREYTPTLTSLRLQKLESEHNGRRILISGLTEFNQKQLFRFIRESLDEHAHEELQVAFQQRRRTPKYKFTDLTSIGEHTAWIVMRSDGHLTIIDLLHPEPTQPVTQIVQNIEHLTKLKAYQMKKTDDSSYDMIVFSSTDLSPQYVADTKAERARLLAVAHAAEQARLEEEETAARIARDTEMAQRAKAYAFEEARRGEEKEARRQAAITTMLGSSVSSVEL